MASTIAKFAARLLAEGREPQEVLEVITRLEAIQRRGLPGAVTVEMAGGAVTLPGRRSARVLRRGGGKVEVLRRKRR